MCRIALTPIHFVFDTTTSAMTSKLTTTKQKFKMMKHDVVEKFNEQSKVTK